MATACSVAALPGVAATIPTANAVALVTRDAAPMRRRVTYGTFGLRALS